MTNRGSGTPEATDKQRNYAAALGIEIPDGCDINKARRLISTEVKRQGEQAYKQYQPYVHMLINHGKHGLCEITRINVDTGKMSLRRLTEKEEPRLDEYGKKRQVISVDLTHLLRCGFPGNT